MKKYSFLAIVLLELVLLFEYSLPVYSWGAWIITACLALLCTSRKVFFSFASWWLLIYFICAFLIIAVFKYVPLRFTMSSQNIVVEDFHYLSSTTIFLFLFYFISQLLFNSNSGRRKKIIETQHVPGISLVFVIILGLSLSLLSKVLGIGNMATGAEVRLPFHLSGIIQFIRTDLIPILALAAYIKEKKKGRFILFFLIWCLVESWVRVSKSVIITGFLPIIIYELLSSTKSSKDTLKPFIPIAIIALLLYPVVENLRSDDSAQIELSQDSDKGATFNNPNTNSYLVRPFNRLFYSGYLYLCDQSYVERKFFDFSRASIIYLVGGSARYQTKIIDRYPDDAHHSSGSTTFIDAFLVGGYGMLFIFVVLYVILSVQIDRRVQQKKNLFLTTILMVAYYKSFELLSLSAIVDAMSIRYYLTYGGFYIVFKLILKRKRQHLVPSSTSVDFF